MSLCTPSLHTPREGLPWGLSQESLRDWGIPEGLWGWRGAWQESLEKGFFLVLVDRSLEECGHHQLNRAGKAHQAAPTSASLGFLKHSYSKER